MKSAPVILVIMTSPPSQIQIELKEKILNVTLPQKYEIVEVIASMESFLEDHSPASPLGALLDLSHSAEFRSSNDLRAAFKYWIPMTKWIARFAILVNKELHFALTRQMAVYSSDIGIDIAPFTSEKEAVVWLKEKLQQGS